MTKSAPDKGSDYNAEIIKEFRANQGRVGGPWAGTTLILIHHSGGRSGVNTRDFRCLRHSGLLPLSCSVLVFESGFVVPLPECGHGFVPRVAAGWGAGPRSGAPAVRAGFPPRWVAGSAGGSGADGSADVTCGFPVT